MHRLLVITLVMLLAGCLGGSKRDDAAPAVAPRDALPSPIQDDRGGLEGSSSLKECGSVRFAWQATCFQYPFTLTRTARLVAALDWSDASANMAVWLSLEGSGVAEVVSDGSTSHIRLETMLAVPGDYVLWVQATQGFTLDATFHEPPRGTPTAPVTSYLHDLSRSTPDFDFGTVIVEQYRIPSTDGVRLDTWVVRPPTADVVPIVALLTPYYSGGRPLQEDPGDTGLQPLGAVGTFLLPRGYALAISSVRGTGASEGCFTIGGRQEAIDSAVVIQHLAGQPWSNGRVGAIGVSYDGTTVQDVWVEAPPALKAIIPVSAESDHYKYSFVNGVPSYNTGHAFNIYYWALFGLLPSPGNDVRSTVADPNAAQALAGEACADRVEVTEGGASSTLDGNKDGYWQERDFLAELQAAPSQKRAAVLYVHGLQDWNVKPNHVEGWLEALQSAGVPFKAWLGQWGHSFPSRADWEAVMLAWFDQFLKDRETGILDAPAVQVQDDSGTWRHETRWPSPPQETLMLHLDSEGRLSGTHGDGTASYLDADPNGALFGQSLPLVPTTKVEFVSGPMARDLHVSGQPLIHLNVTSSGTRASLLATLVERTEVGDRPFNYAAQSLNHIASIEAGDEDITGQRQHMRLAFFPQEDVVRAGNRLVLSIGSNFVLPDNPYNPNASSHPAPALQPIWQGSTVTLDLSGSSLSLPLVHDLVVEDPQPAGKAGSTV